MKITVEHEIPYDPTDESRCVYGGGDFWGEEVCQYYKRRDRTHGRKAPIERQQPKCTLFDEWLPGDYVKCESCRKAIGAAEQNPKPLTLDELIRMDGEPIWTVTIGLKGSGRWELCEGYTIRACPFKGALRCVDLSGEATLYDYKTYGKTWLAYRTKPEGSGE